YFLANLRGLPVSCSKRFVAETVSRAISAAAVMKISPAPFRGLLFSRAEQLKPGEDKRIGGGNSCGNGDLFLAKAEQLPLFCPIRRQPWREADQCLSCELQRLSAVDNGRGDVGRQPGKTQKGIEIGGRHV